MFITGPESQYMGKGKFLRVNRPTSISSLNDEAHDSWQNSYSVADPGKAKKKEVKKKKVTEGRKVGRASETKPPPPHPRLSSRSGAAICSNSAI